MMRKLVTMNQLGITLSIDDFQNLSYLYRLLTDIGPKSDLTFTYAS
ncbi:MULTISPECIES: hypothetical protein [Bacillaceae]|uniref:EAL domain-containing protein n=1 Tax=Peribacillus huizhouensis TaxID=1501239 RepID=A0ABR6CS76_9BACI|nr:MULTISPECIES: hypothetical protein [Bacillaceae]MBA9027761.1 hypothetical protein [Peribacillus huizhouensis]